MPLLNSEEKMAANVGRFDEWTHTGSDMWMRDDERNSVSLMVCHNAKHGYQSMVSGMGAAPHRDLTFTGPWRPDADEAKGDAERLADYLTQFSAELRTKLHVTRRTGRQRQPSGGHHAH